MNDRKINEEMSSIKAISLVTLLCVAVTSSQSINPGNTYSNCIQPIRRATCKSINLLNSGFRTADGTCNNLRKVTAGAKNTPLRRLLNADYVDKRDMPRGFPGTKPRVPPANRVSKVSFKVDKTNKLLGRLTVLFMTFGQFLDHDFTLATHPESHKTDCKSKDAFKYPSFPILFKNGGKKCTGFSRANPVCQTDAERKSGKPRNQINELTAYIDASQVYGSDLEHSRRLRTFNGKGTLKIKSDGLLEQDQHRKNCPVLGGCSLAGESRSDENIALNSMHTVWVREHNRIAEELKSINPRWDDERLYQTARKIVGGIMQHIVYTEWLPHVARLPRYTGYKRRKNPAIGNAFSTAAFRFGHSLIPVSFSQLNNNFDHRFEPVTLQTAFRNRQFILNHGIEPTMFGLMGNRSNKIDHRFSFGIMRKLFVRPGKKDHMDLTAFNIQRGRDHGIPTYGKWRKACRLPSIRNFKQLNRYMLPKTVRGFKKLYKSPNDIDLFAAGISEKHVRGLQVGPTFACIIGHQFQMLMDADRYFYLNRGVFTSRQLREIRKASIARVMCNTLKGIVSIQRSAFKVPSRRNRRISCSRIPKLNLRAWKN